MRNVLRYLFGGFCLFMLTAGQVRAQTVADAWRFSQRLPGVGARLTAMSGASAAGLADYGALYSNPAGLGYYRASEVIGGLTWMNARDAATYYVPGNRFDWESELRATNLDHLAAVYKVPTVRGSLVLGMAYARVADFTRRLYFQGDNSANSITDSYLPYPGEYTVTDDGDLQFNNDIPFIAYQAGAIEFLPAEYEAGRYPFYQAVAPGTTIRQIGEVTEEGGLHELSFGGAIEAAPDLFLGVSIGIVTGFYRFERQYEEDDFRDENTPDLYEVAVEGGLLRGFDYLRAQDFFEADLQGFSVRAGLSARLSPSWRLGASIETPVFFSVQEEYSTVLETFFDEGGSLQYGGQPGDAGTGSFDYEIRTPWRLRIGAAYQTRQLYVGLDLELIDWSQLRFDAATDRSFIQELNRQVRDMMEPVVNTRLGLAYQLGGTTLYGGLAVFPDPHRSEIRETETDRQRVFGSLGASIQLAESFRFHIGWTQEQFEDYYQPYGDVERPPFVRETVRRNRLVIGLTYTLPPPKAPAIRRRR
ncbi:OmpP1/FadL family transporter [Rhodothermus profundi]|uniref:Outer membrane protein transport protein (OMPP1/FadL/TodX) n=1 Tax=Rhodothermus profundi TaxID=633813 RepID=A0A1M6QG82_9BACT|nr:hypothetical protein [Rhodothermus profundi]SHK19226.1 hypothetical protein SAMN04488087_0609 [Rhodothermus profundi]